jgi:hypothetical protein
MKFFEKNYARFFIIALSHPTFITSCPYNVLDLSPLVSQSPMSCLPPCSLSNLPFVNPLYFSIVYSSISRMEAEVFPNCGELVTKLHIITSQITVISKKNYA